MQAAEFCFFSVSAPDGCICTVKLTPCILLQMQENKRELLMLLLETGRPCNNSVFRYNVCKIVIGINSIGMHMSIISNK